jgi:hypothetical protein
VSDTSATFTKLEKLRRYLGVLRDNHLRSLNFYFNASFAGFYHKHEKDKPRMSKSSTATCVLSLTRAGLWAEGPWSATTANTVRILLEDDWISAGLERDNAFTVSHVLEAVTALGDLRSVGDDEILDARLLFAEDILEKALKAGRGSVSVNNYPPSAYLTQLAARVLKRREKLRPEIAIDICLWASREIDHQLALLRASSKTADLFQLMYSVVLVASFGAPGEATPDQNLILAAALDEFFSRQLDDGTWPRSRPLFHYPGVGSAYCYEYELLVQLLHTTSLHERLLRYWPKLTRAAEALEETSFPLENGGKGWTSGHHPQLRGPESWSTASVYHFAYALDRLLAEAIRRSIFEELDAPYTPPTQPKVGFEKFAAELLDCPVRLSEGQNSLRDVLFKHFVEPISKDAQRVEDGRSMDSSTPMSAIFFGPPGTSKTELSKQIAEFLGWPRLTVDPSYFVKQGMDQIQTQADRLFNFLAVAERIVVLLDEFDEMVRDRAHSTEFFSRFLTTAMLPKLATINKSRRIVFIVATNYIGNFDLAISRSGRFDRIIQIMPPTADEKLRKWSDVKDSLDKFGVANDHKIRSQIEKLTFDEFKSVAPRIAAAQNLDALRRSLEEAEQRCTLRAPMDVANADVDWEVACRDQEKKMRIPVGAG